MKKIEIEIPDGKKAEWVNGVLTLVDEPKDVTERIKTFEDACEALGNEHPFVEEYWGVVNTNPDIARDLIAYLKLRIITTALNEGWEPTFDEDEYRYYPYFYLRDEKECDCRVPLRSGSSAHANGGLVFAVAYVAGSFSFSNHGVRLVFRTREIAEYCGNQFIDIWVDFLFK